MAELNKVDTEKLQNEKFERIEKIEKEIQELKDNNGSKERSKFAAIGQSLVEIMPSSASSKLPGQDVYGWGRDNKYPDYLYNLTQTSSTLSAIISGCIDYVGGNGITRDTDIAPNDTDTWGDLIAKLTFDYLVYGVCYVNVLRNVAGDIVQYHWLDARKVRTNKNGSVFYLADEWGQWVKKFNTVPAFTPDSVEYSSILAIRTPLSRDTYPTPIWSAAIPSANLERKIDVYHTSEIENNFNASVLINFNNGRPTDKEKKEIEKMIAEKFSGEENVGRFILSFNDSKDNQATVAKMETADFANRYSALEKSARQKLFSTFRANPNLFGIATENNGFNSEEYQSSFKLFNRTMIKPIQTTFVREFAKVVANLTIAPFTLD